MSSLTETIEALGHVAVCPRTLSRHAPFREALAGRAASVRWNDGDHRLAGNDLARFVEGAERIVVGMERVDAALLERAPALRSVAKFGVGLDNLDLDTLEARGVAVGWTPGVNRRAVAELVLGGMLASLRELPEGERQIRSGALARGTWRAGVGRELGAQRVGIVGCGHVGLEVARLLSALGVLVVGHDIRDRREHLDPLGFPQVDLDELCDAASIVTLHTPLDDTTRGFLGADRIARLRSGVIVVNTARGELIDEAALAAALDSGHVRAAFLDVLAEEPAAPGPLTSHPRVLVSPHVGGRTEQSIAAMADAALRNLAETASVAALRARLHEGRIEP